MRLQDQGAAVSEWQPIETAPKDGEWILAAVIDLPCGGIYLSMPRSENWRPNNYSFGGGLWKDWSGTGVNVTHWMPLPAPPGGSHE
jgi:hypothetical protein